MKQEIEKLFPWRNKAKWSAVIKHKKVCTTLTYIEHFLILASTITGCISIYAFVSLIVIPVVITSSPIRLKICAICAGIKNFKSIIKNKKKRMIK